MKRALVAVIISFIGNIILIVYIATNHPASPSQESSAKQFPYLSKRIFTDDQNDTIINFTQLRSKLQQLSSTIPERHGIYFEYLPSGISIGINEKEPFVLASLLKLPVAIALRSQYGLGTIKPNQIVTLKRHQLNDQFGTLWKQGEGAQVSVEELERRMLIDSDNTAGNALFEILPPLSIDSIFDSLDIPKVFDRNTPVVTAKNYSSILRSLYLSSILPKDQSNEILHLLTETPFNKKLAAGVPNTVLIAHKIGVYISADQKKHMYTDCGVVYPPKRPYILCVMTETDENRADTIISSISSAVYTYVINANHLK